MSELTEAAPAAVDVPSRRVVVELTAHGGPEVMRLAEEPVPEPADGEVLVAVEAIGVNFGDVLVRRGEYRPGAPLSMRPGFEVAGRVLADRAEGRFAPGDPVVAFTDHGGYASVVAVPAARVVPRPADMPAVEAAGLFIQGVTAWYAVHRYGRARAGEHVLVHAGAGGVGSLAIQLARDAGAVPIATASSEEKRRIARERGAAAALAPDPATLREALREATGGAGVDVVVDGVGGELFDPSFGALAAGGRYVVIGAASREAAPLDVRRLMPRAVTVTGFVVAQVVAQDPREPGAAFASLHELVRAGAVEHPVTAMPLSEVASAHEQLESRRLAGKIVLTVEEAR